MSLILDALRKSEAERRRGQVPDLFAPVATRTAPTTKSGTALLAIAILAVAAAAAIAFWPTTPVQEQTTRGDAHVATTPSATSVAPAPMAAVAKPAPATRHNTASLATSSPLPTVKPELPLPVMPPPSMPATAPTPVDNNVPPSNAGIDDSQVDAQETALPTLATLDSATRAGSPPLQLSMHVWNEDATKRFAIIDGQRVGEGGRIGNAVVIGIRRDGVVLDIDGRQFLLPRP